MKNVIKIVIVLVFTFCVNISYSQNNTTVIDTTVNQNDTVNFVLPKGLFGTIIWEKSIDKIIWKEILNNNNDTLSFIADTNQYFRAKIINGSCNPIYSDTILVLVVKLNTYPVASFIANPDTGFVSTTFSFDANGSFDAEDNIENIQVRWDFNNDSVFETQFSTTKTATYQYSSAGIYKVRLEVKDTEGLTKKLTKTIVVNSDNFNDTNKFVVNGFEMIWVEGDTFTMGCVSVNDSNCYSNEKPAHQVILNGFYIGKYEVTQGQWKAIMGNNPSYYTGCGDNCPVERVSWNDAQEFITKLNQKTGKSYSLPTEAEWEFAARGGNKSKDYKYSGSDDINAVGWNKVNSGSTTHQVGMKQPNELGIYDMSGNVIEWCYDFYGSYSENTLINPLGPNTGTNRVNRGGGYSYESWFCRVFYRNYSTASNKTSNLGFRLSIKENYSPKANIIISPPIGTISTVFTFDATQCYDAQDNIDSLKVRWDFNNDGIFETQFSPSKTTTYQYSIEGKYTVKLEVIDTDSLISSSIKTIIVNPNDTGGIKIDKIDMVWVERDTFTMGCTAINDSDCSSIEKPVHQVILNGFYIGKYEVTQGLWKTVMGTNPAYYNGCGDNCPVERVSWNDAQEFITKLNEKTGKNYRLPTEAEWEFAARGGNQSQNYKYSGSNDIDNVAWYKDNSGGETRQVGMKQANELGIYDMTGNVFEWCNDFYGYYSNDSQTNPSGTNTGTTRVSRGGSYNYDLWFARLFGRNYNTPTTKTSSLGFRLSSSGN